MKRAVWTSLSKPAERLWRRRRDEVERREEARRQLGAVNGVVGVVERIGGKVGVLAGEEEALAAVE